MFRKPMVVCDVGKFQLAQIGTLRGKGGWLFCKKETTEEGLLCSRCVYQLSLRTGNVGEKL